MISRYDNIHVGLEKLAGGGARTFKSFRRALEKRLRVILSEKIPNWNELSKVQQSRAIDKAVVRQMNASPHIVTERSDSVRHLPFGRRKGRDTTYFTHGEQTWTGGDLRDSRLRDRIRKTDVVPVEDISKMRGKFVTDRVASALPVSGMDKFDALFFRGRIPKNPKKYEVTRAKAQQMVEAAAARAHKRGKPHQAMMKAPEGDFSMGGVRYGDPMPSMTIGQAQVIGPTIKRYAAKPQNKTMGEFRYLADDVDSALGKLKKPKITFKRPLMKKTAAKKVKSPKQY